MADLVGGKPALLVINKNDLPSVQNGAALADFLPAAQAVSASQPWPARGLNLEAAITELVTGGSVTLADTPLVSNPRHKALLHRALTHTQAAIEAQTAGIVARFSFY